MLTAPIAMGSVYAGTTAPLVVSVPSSVPVGDYVLSVDLTDEEIARRLANWTPKPRAYTQGVLAKYAALVAQANDGAITRVGMDS